MPLSEDSCLVVELFSALAPSKTFILLAVFSEKLLSPSDSIEIVFSAIWLAIAKFPVTKPSTILDLESPVSFTIVFKFSKAFEVREMPTCDFSKKLVVLLDLLLDLFFLRGILLTISDIYLKLIVIDASFFDSVLEKYTVIK